MKPKIAFITMSDTHVNNQNYKRLQKEFLDEDNGILVNILSTLDYLKENDIRLGGFLYCGDWFDTKLSLDSPAIDFSIDMIGILAEAVLTHDEDAIFTMLRGTYSHDYSQLKLFKYLQSLYPNRFFIVDKPMEFDVLGYKVLNIPEEYGINLEAEYEQYFNKKYDVFCFHGFFKFNCFNKNEIEKPLPEAIILDQDKVMKMARITMCGHDHHRQEFGGKRIMYNGSTSRLQHGDEQAKGFHVIFLDEETHEVEFIENTLAPIFKSVRLDYIYNNPMEEGEYQKYLNEYIDKIIEYKENNNIKYLKILVDGSMNKELFGVLRQYFSAHYSSSEVKFQLVGSNKVITGGMEVEVDKEEEVKNEYDFLTDSKLSIQERVFAYINKHNDRYQKEITLDDIKTLTSI